MKFASFIHAGRAGWGLVEGDSVADLTGIFPDLKSAIAADGLTFAASRAATAPKIALDRIAYQPVLPNPEKIFCIGLNYADHVKETGRSDSEFPTVFARFANSQIGHLQPLICPKNSTAFDYEGELAIIIGKAGRHISKADSWSHIAGYACYNEGSVRDFQRHTHQFHPGKNFPGTGAFGPVMVTPDEVGPLDKLRLQTRVNGLVVQDALIEQMIFDIPRQIEYCSSFTRLEPGDVIVSGTPGGVGSRRNPPLWLKAGDVTEIEIDRVGLLRNTVIDEA
ncbi:MAG: fumarylacetoacetate hydrolase family protein [Acetobacteraceae bacterium]|nr:fumarylacetoacetate hydrolase family protein [Acetobacteraceae bacterium]